MRTLAADIGDCSDRIPHNFMLHVEVPLLNVRPFGLCGNGIYAERELCLRLATAGVAIDIIPLLGIR